MKIKKNVENNLINEKNKRMDNSIRILKDNEDFLEDHGKDIQAHIFSPHRKRYASYLFLKFSDVLANKEKTINFLKILGDGEKKLRIVSFQENNSNKHVFINIYLTADGLEYFGFKEGWEEIINNLRSKKEDLLFDESRHNQLEQMNVHAVILLAHENKTELISRSESLKNRFSNKYGAIIVEKENGITYRRKKIPNQQRGSVVEHFGYADGLSNPWIIGNDAKLKDGTPKSKTHWDLTASVHDFIIPEPSIDDPHFGSYLVYRKFEQNVKEFDDTMKTLSTKTGGYPKDEIGSFVFGRIKNGTPVEDPNVLEKAYNDFKYDTGKCPFFAHIRKANPRDEKEKIKMIRRGITYGERDEIETSVGGYELDEKSVPKEEVGLLFFSFVNNIDNFQKVLRRCRDKKNGVDPILGYIYGSDPLSTHTFPHKTEGSVAYKGMAGLVDLKEGINLYMPSIHFFQTLHLNGVTV